MGRVDSKIKRRVYQYIDKMQNKVGVNIPRDNYPEVRVTTRTGSMYNPESNILIIGRGGAHSGDNYGEEIGHYLRAQLQPENKRSKFLEYLGRKGLKLKPKKYKQEKLTDEFFGYLGRRILKETVGENTDLKFELEKSFGTKKDSLNQIKKIKESKQQYHQYSSGEKKDPDNILTPRFAKLKEKCLEGKRRDILEHDRGYRFASKVDLDKLDYKELYSLPNKEVRSRFFRKEPQYTEPISLETKLVTTILISLSSVYFLKYQLTGNTILQAPTTLDKGIFIVLGILILFGLNKIFKN